MRRLSLHFTGIQKFKTFYEKSVVTVKEVGILGFVVFCITLYLTSLTRILH